MSADLNPTELHSDSCSEKGDSKSCRHVENRCSYMLVLCRSSTNGMATVYHWHVCCICEPGLTFKQNCYIRGNRSRVEFHSLFCSKDKPTDPLNFANKGQTTIKISAIQCKMTAILPDQMQVNLSRFLLPAKLLAASGRELRRALFSLKQIFQVRKLCLTLTL